jgi:hypothetical protein
MSRSKDLAEEWLCGADQRGVVFEKMAVVNEHAICRFSASYRIGHEG